MGDIKASDVQKEDSFTLVRLIQPSAGVGDEEIEACHYYTKDSKIIFEEDTVYGPEYDSLNTDIDKHLNFVTACSASNSYWWGSNNSYAVNFLVAILSATGHKNGSKIDERLNIPLCVRDGTASSQGWKIAIFSSADFKATLNKLPFSLEEFVKQLPKENNKYLRNYKKYAFFNLDSKDLPEQFRPGDNYTENNRHTEPLCLNALLSLPKTAFLDILPKGYILDYYEIHFISVHDACGRCVPSVYENISTLKSHFSNPNLFIFFHSKVPDSPYMVKYGENQYANGNFSYEHFKVYPLPEWLKKLKEGKKKPILSRRSEGEFNIPIPYYIGILNYMDVYESIDIQ